MYNAKGLDIIALMKHRKETGSIVDFPGSENVDRDEALAGDRDPVAENNLALDENMRAEVAVGADPQKPWVWVAHATASRA